MRAIGLLAGLQWLAFSGSLVAAAPQPSFPLSSSLEPPPAEGGWPQEHPAEQQFLVAAASLMEELKTLAAPDQQLEGGASEERLQMTMDDYLLSLLPLFFKIHTDSSVPVDSITNAWRELRRVLSASASEDPTARYTLLFHVFTDLKLPTVSEPTIINLADARLTKPLQGMSFMAASMIKVYCWIMRIERLEWSVGRAAFPEHWLRMAEGDLDSILRVFQTCQAYHERYMQLRQQAEPDINSYLVLDGALRALQRSISLGFTPNCFQSRLVQLQQSRLAYSSPKIAATLQSCVALNYWKEKDLLSTFAERLDALRRDSLAWGKFTTKVLPRVVWEESARQKLLLADPSVPASPEQAAMLEDAMAKGVNFMRDLEGEVWKSTGCQYPPYSSDLLLACKCSTDLLRTYDLGQLSTAIRMFLEVLWGALSHFKDYIQVLGCSGKLPWQKCPLPWDLFSKINSMAELLNRLQTELGSAIFHDLRLKQRVEDNLLAAHKCHEKISNDLKLIPSLALEELKPVLLPLQLAPILQGDGQPSNRHDLLQSLPYF